MRITLVAALIGGLCAAEPSLAQDTASDQGRAATPVTRPGGLAAPVPASDLGPTFSLMAGVDYSTGDYGIDRDTDILIAPLSARYADGPFRVWAVLPYLRIESPGTVFGGGEGGPIFVAPSVPGPREVREGLGDLSLGVAYLLPPERVGGFEVDLSARVKLPTSKDSEGLSTDKTDFSLVADVSRPVGRVAPFVTLGYRFLGDPDGFDLRDSVSVSVGASVEVGEAGVAIFSYNYAQAATRLVDDPQDLLAAFSGRVSERVRWTVYGVAGLGDGSPDVGGGLFLTIGL